MYDISPCPCLESSPDQVERHEFRCPDPPERHYHAWYRESMLRGTSLMLFLQSFAWHRASKHTSYVLYGCSPDKWSRLSYTGEKLLECTYPRTPNGHYSCNRFLVTLLPAIPPVGSLIDSDLRFDDDPHCDGILPVLTTKSSTKSDAI